MKKSSLLGFALLASISASTAVAGQKFSAPVYVGTTSASGYMGAARNSTNSVESIGCYSTAYADSVTIVCWATNAQGVSVTCAKGHAPQSFLTALSQITSESQVSFNFAGNPPSCTQVRVSNGSGHEPKTPPPAQSTTVGGVF